MNQSARNGFQRQKNAAAQKMIELGCLKWDGKLQKRRLKRKRLLEGGVEKRIVA